MAGWSLSSLSSSLMQSCRLGNECGMVVHLRVKIGQQFHWVQHGNICGGDSAGVNHLCHCHCGCCLHHHIWCCCCWNRCICIICWSHGQLFFLFTLKGVPLSGATLNLMVDCCVIDRLSLVMVVAGSIINMHWVLYACCYVVNCTTCWSSQNECIAVE